VSLCGGYFTRSTCQPSGPISAEAMIKLQEDDILMTNFKNRKMNLLEAIFDKIKFSKK
jgi:ABC-type hemin transport system substrate-binding protein